jgi:hypothetical protein
MIKKSRKITYIQPIFGRIGAHFFRMRYASWYLCREDLTTELKDVGRQRVAWRYSTCVFSPFCEAMQAFFFSQVEIENLFDAK